MEFFRRIAERFRRKPKPPKIEEAPEDVIFGGGPWGHGGIAASSLEPGEQNLSPENVAKWRMLTEEEAKGFLQGELLFVHSSNIAALQWFPEAEKMVVEFLNGSAYMISPISRKEAVHFLQAQSKGGAYWDRVRVRGTRYGHKKDVVKIR